jgi:hypothetical protein
MFMDITLIGSRVRSLASARRLKADVGLSPSL